MPIVAMGGVPNDALLDYVLGLGRGRRVLYVPTAGLEDAAATVTWFERLHGRAEMTPLSFHPWPPPDLRGLALTHDVIIVTGGNTANMLAIWRTHGFDDVLREAWERGIVLAGWSAGAICWFESGLTDSFGPQLESMECLGFLPGSACPHYDGEELRRPRYAELLRAGMAPGIAIDDDAGARFDGTELTEVVSSRAAATAYRVSAESEVPLEARLLQ
jgi:dipeptidase E